MKNAKRFVVAVLVVLIVGVGASVARADLEITVTGVEPGADVFVAVKPAVKGVAGKGKANSTGTAVITIATSHSFKKGDKAFMVSSKDGSKKKFKGNNLILGPTAAGDYYARIKGVPF